MPHAKTRSWSTCVAAALTLAAWAAPSPAQQTGHASREHSHSHAANPEHPAASDDYVIEITAAGPNLWDLKLRSRTLRMSIVEQGGKPYVKLVPVTKDGAPSPYSAETSLSLEIDPTTATSRSIRLRNEGAYLITADPVQGGGDFNAAIYMHEGDHEHRRRFRFPVIR